MLFCPCSLVFDLIHVPQDFLQKRSDTFFVLNLFYFRLSSLPFLSGALLFYLFDAFFGDHKCLFRLLRHLFRQRAHRRHVFRQGLCQLCPQGVERARVHHPHLLHDSSHRSCSMQFLLSHPFLLFLANPFGLGLPPGLQLALLLFFLTPLLLLLAPPLFLLAPLVFPFTPSVLLLTPPSLFLIPAMLFLITLSFRLGLSSRLALAPAGLLLLSSPALLFLTPSRFLFAPSGLLLPPQGLLLTPMFVISPAPALNMTSRVLIASLNLGLLFASASLLGLLPPPHSIVAPSLGFGSSSSHIIFLIFTPAWVLFLHSPGLLCSSPRSIRFAAPQIHHYVAASALAVDDAVARVADGVALEVLRCLPTPIVDVVILVPRISSLHFVTPRTPRRLRRHRGSLRHNAFAFQRRLLGRRPSRRTDEGKPHR
mmetsp:Transcript_8980/g.23413  ORF Transcript_8980/g.23413 Transcript_8980/m.23413 type:complete len:424 (+) Transcript_8980:952-2223(+)